MLEDSENFDDFPDNVGIGVGRITQLSNGTYVIPNDLTTCMAQISTQYTFGITKIMPNITFSFKDGSYTYEPTHNITSYEVALLMKLFTCVHSGGYQIDFEGFIKLHELERHFVKV